MSDDAVDGEVVKVVVITAGVVVTVVVVARLGNGVGLKAMIGASVGAGNGVGVGRRGARVGRNCVTGLAVASLVVQTDFVVVVAAHGDGVDLTGLAGW